jgi:hypothetical protein
MNRIELSYTNFKLIINTFEHNLTFDELIGVRTTIDQLLESNSQKINKPTTMKEILKLMKEIGNKEDLK